MQIGQARVCLFERDCIRTVECVGRVTNAGKAAGVNASVMVGAR